MSASNPKSDVFDGDVQVSRKSAHQSTGITGFDEPENANRKDAKAQRFAKTMHFKEPAIPLRVNGQFTDFLCVPSRLGAFAVMNCGFQDEIPGGNC